MSKVWRRASDGWDRTRVPPAFDAGTTWERIEQGERHIGARRRVIDHIEESLRIEETLALAEGAFVGTWSSSMSLTGTPEPTWTSYTFAIGEDDPVTYRCESEAAVPRFAAYPVIVKVPFEAGHLNPFTVLDDRTGKVADESTLVSVGWDEAVNGQWWRIDQYNEGERRAAYWLDAQHRLMRSDWEGAALVRVGTRAEALGDLVDLLDRVFGADEDSSDHEEPVTDGGEEA
jgi:hypothetical protein